MKHFKVMIKWCKKIEIEIFSTSYSFPLIMSHILPMPLAFSFLLTTTHMSLTFLLGFAYAANNQPTNQPTNHRRLGMSTCPEVTTARHMGMQCFGLTLVSNLAIMGYNECNGIPNHEEVLETGKSREPSIQMLIAKMVERLWIWVWWFSCSLQVLSKVNLYRVSPTNGCKSLWTSLSHELFSIRR